MITQLDTLSVYPPALQGVLLVVLLLAACVWIGGWAIAIVVARTTAGALPPADRVAFFRLFGRRYGIVTTIALVIALAAGLILLLGMPWTALSTWLIVLSAVLVVILGIGVAQARKLTRRRRELASRHDPALAASVAAEARRGTVLRASLGVISVVILIMAVIRMM